MLKRRVLRFGIKEQNNNMESIITMNIRMVVNTNQYEEELWTKADEREEIKGIKQAVIDVLKAECEGKQFNATLIKEIG